MVKEKKPEETAGKVPRENPLKKLNKLKTLKLWQKILLGILVIMIALFSVHKYLELQDRYDFLADKLVAEYAEYSVRKESTSSYAIELYTHYEGNKSIEKKALALIEEGLDIIATDSSKLEFLILTATQMEEMGHFSEDSKDYIDEQMLVYATILMERNRLDYIMDTFDTLDPLTYYSNMLDVLTPEMIIADQRPKIEEMLENNDLKSLLEYAQRNFDDWAFDKSLFSYADLISYDEFVEILEAEAILTIHLANEGGYYDGSESGGSSNVNNIGSVAVSSKSYTAYYGDFKYSSSSTTYSDTISDQYTAGNNEALSSGNSSSASTIFQGVTTTGTVVNGLAGDDDVLAIYYYPVEPYDNMIAVKEESILGVSFQLNYAETVAVAGSSTTKALGESASATASADEEELFTFDTEDYMEFWADTGETYFFGVNDNFLLIFDEQGFIDYIGKLFPDIDASAYELSAIFDENKMVEEEAVFYDEDGNVIDLYYILQHGMWSDSTGEQYDAEGNLIEATLNFDSKGLIETQKAYEDGDDYTHFTMYHYDEKGNIIELTYVYDDLGKKVSVTETYYNSYGYLMD